MLLFENKLSRLEDELAIGFSSESKTAKAFNEKNVSISTLIKNLVNENKETFNKILGLSDSIKYLASGKNGDAYDLGSYILKIELIKEKSKFASEDKTETAASLLYGSTKNKIGKALPMIYDSGYLTLNKKIVLYWSILEKFETIPRNSETFDEVYELIEDIIDGVDFDEPFAKENVRKLGEKLRLGNGWFKKLRTDMKNLANKKIDDFHAGNIGIRRTGGEGYFVFFD